MSRIDIIVEAALREERAEVESALQILTAYLGRWNVPGTLELVERRGSGVFDSFDEIVWERRMEIFCSRLRMPIWECRWLRAGPTSSIAG